MNQFELLANAADPDLSWVSKHVREIGERNIPDWMFGPRHGAILKGDLHSLWANWFLESIVDPQEYSSNGKTWANIFADVFRRINSIQPNATQNERLELSRLIADVINERVEILKSNQKRLSIPTEIRFELLEKENNQPRCWICGYLFLEDACENFVTKKQIHQATNPQFIDLYKPSGLDVRDRQIEVDHVVPHSAGGGDGDNQRLSCGWCNRHKGMFTSLYDVGGDAVKVRTGQLGIHSLPRKFWIVRLLGLVRQCEHPGGCNANVTNTELTIEPIDILGVPNPTNLRVVCGDHHQLGHKRLIQTEIARKIWSAN